MVVAEGRPHTPTLDRRAKIIEESHQIGAFLDWLNDEGIQLARYHDQFLVLLGKGPSALLHKYFGIDPQEEERELRSLLEWTRRASERPDQMTSREQQNTDTAEVLTP